jgi:hypothetical protein
MAEIILTTNVVQKINYTLPSTGKIIVLRLIFDSNQSQWFLDVDYDNGTFAINGRRCHASFNLLQEFENIIPFGIMIISNELIDPFRIESWAFGDTQFYIETIADINTIRGS